MIRMIRRLNYTEVGATRPQDGTWAEAPSVHRRYERTVRIGPARWESATSAVMHWEVKTRSGFAYGTLDGHPVSGEEAFIVHRSPDGIVWLTLRSLTRPAPGLWRLAFPAILPAQRWYRRRYARALLG